MGNIALKKANELLNVEQIEQLLDETKEGIDKQKVNYCCSIVVLSIK